VEITFNSKVTRKPCGWNHRHFMPIPVVEVSEPVTQQVKMRTLPNGARVMVAYRNLAGKVVTRG
jgi:hypothetical protein